MRIKLGLAIGRVPRENAKHLNDDMTRRNASSSFHVRFRQENLKQNAIELVFNANTRIPLVFCAALLKVR